MHMHNERQKALAAELKAAVKNAKKATSKMVEPTQLPSQRTAIPTPPESKPADSMKTAEGAP